MSGKEVAELLNEVQIAGYYTVKFDAFNLASGANFYRISAEETVIILLLRRR